VWLEYLGGDDLGARVRYWQFNHNPDTITASPAANGFGRLTAPPFGNIDLSTTIPGEEMTASSSLELHALDLEGVKVTNFGPWGLAASAGVRYGNFQQGYLNQLHDVNGALEGQIDFQHNFDGIGPTVAIEARRWLPGRFSAFSSARGALLFGNRRSTLTAGEDLDLSTPFITTENNSRYDTIPVAEMQLGLDWHTRFTHFATLFLQIAMEAQWWQDIGTAATEEGNLGLFGFNTAVGLIW